jgi:SAM-dependent methyltransferase
MPELFNRTRTSQSIPLSLVRRGRVLEVPIYYLLRTSDLAREGLDRSGSHRFADHIYANQPSGRGPFGRWLDARLLSMPAVRSFRNRYVAARDEVTRFLNERAGGTLDLLSVPCGIPRELADGARQSGERHANVTFHGVDLDPAVLEEAREFAAARGLEPFVAHRGDALERDTHPAGADFITCTGFAEFLDDRRVARLYEVLFDVLRPGGRLVTTAMRRVPRSDYLLRLAELRVNYRTASELEAILRRLPFAGVSVRTDELGIQAIAVADK